MTFTGAIADRDHLFRPQIEMTIIFEITVASHRSLDIITDIMTLATLIAAAHAMYLLGDTMHTQP